MTEPQKQALKRLVRSFYDFQGLKNQAGGRGRKKADHAPAILDKEDIVVLDGLSDGLSTLEAQTLKEIEARVSREPIGRWLMAQRGIGPTLAGVFLTEIDIRRCGTASSLWKFAGLDVVAGHAPRMEKGVKRPWNAFLKTKVVGVAADCIMKACVRTKPQKGWKRVCWAVEIEPPGTSETPAVIERAGTDETPKHAERAVGGETPGNVERAAMDKTPADCERADDDEIPAARERAMTLETPDPNERYVTGYAILYANQRNRRNHQKVSPCMGCQGTSKVVYEGRKVNCTNCDAGQLTVAPWGKSDAHRDRDAKRVMMKWFLLDMWKTWRELEGLPARPAYSEEKLGMKHSASVAKLVEGARAPMVQSEPRI